MTDEQIEAMEGRELDAAVAEKVLGLTEYEHDFQQDPGDCSRCEDAHMDMAYIRGPKKCSVPPCYSTDIAAAFEMETELERRGLKAAYTHALIEIIRPFVGKGETDFLFALTHALAIHRCKAALRAARAEGK